ncbi:universal stress protein [Allopontixanthobacter sp.]|uniref:universal stress protein n=1 Tax=Allopontixanthobacter sp. TaxID=2906452 RepID=UPI002ABCDBD0|nr:universal stress protein [Allopontixanthobacter sp.]MDZ4308127.1 universal stress protein [Allopontixanthobacter sp.]MDZ4327458.1 universal stress protein [Pseudomonas sp.]
MFQKIVLAFDGGEESVAALHQATDLARLCDAELILIGVVESIPSAALTEPYPQHAFLTAKRSSMAQMLLTEAERLGDRGLKVVTEILEGDPANEIATYAKRIDADVVVIGYAYKGFLVRWLEGSTGAKLIRDLPCSLLIATER